MQVAGGGAGSAGDLRGPGPGSRRRSQAGAPRSAMAGWWRALTRAAGRHPWPTNVLLYASLFSAGDAVQQRLRGGSADWQQTRCVATVTVTFHGNFNYVWQRLLERALPGRTPRTILAKLLCDQVISGPVMISAFYIGEEIGTGGGSHREERGGVGRSGVRG